MKWVYRCLSAAFATLAVAMPLFDKPEERIPADPLGIIYHDITTDPGVGGYGQKAYRFDDRMVLVNLKNKQDDDLDHFDPDGFYNIEDIDSRDDAISEDTIERMSELAMENIKYRQKAQRVVSDTVRNGKPLKTMTRYLSDRFPFLSYLSNVPILSKLCSIKTEKPINWVNVYAREESWEPPVTVIVNEIGDVTFSVAGDEPYSFTDDGGNGSMDETIKETQSGISTEKYRREVLDKLMRY